MEDKKTIKIPLQDAIDSHLERLKEEYYQTQEETKGFWMAADLELRRGKVASITEWPDMLYQTDKEKYLQEKERMIKSSRLYTPDNE